MVDTMEAVHENGLFSGAPFGSSSIASLDRASFSAHSGNDLSRKR
jgi:hypothetical protein